MFQLDVREFLWVEAIVKLYPDSDAWFFVSISHSWRTPFLCMIGLPFPYLSWCLISTAFKSSSKPLLPN